MAAPTSYFSSRRPPRPADKCLRRLATSANDLVQAILQQRRFDNHRSLESEPAELVNEINPIGHEQKLNGAGATTPIAQLQPRLDADRYGKEDIPNLRETFFRSSGSTRKDKLDKAPAPPSYPIW
jgi:hypothetical protein